MLYHQLPVTEENTKAVRATAWAANALPLALRVPATRIGEIVGDPSEGRGKPRGVSADIAIRGSLLRDDAGVLAEPAIGF